MGGRTFDIVSADYKAGRAKLACPQSGNRFYKVAFRKYRRESDRTAVSANGLSK
jgi:hypothetical protein